jgi:hypothetical protein
MFYLVERKFLKHWTLYLDTRASKLRSELKSTQLFPCITQRLHLTMCSFGGTYRLHFQGLTVKQTRKQQKQDISCEDKTPLSLPGVDLHHSSDWGTEQLTSSQLAPEDFAHHEFYMKLPGTEPKAPRWEAGV